MTNKVLIIEDDQGIRDLLTHHLNLEGYQVDEASDGRMGISKATSTNYHAIILDWELPTISGIDVLKELRKTHKMKTPIIMATSRIGTEDIDLSFEEEADDYLAKPYNTKVLCARIKSLIKKTALENPVVVKQFPNLLVDQSKGVVEVSGQYVHLTSSEFRMLTALVANYDQVLSRKRMIMQIQGEGICVIPRSIDTHMVSLRKKLGVCGVYIKTVRGMGYKFSCD